MHNFTRCWTLLALVLLSPVYVTSHVAAWAQSAGGLPVESLRVVVLYDGRVFEGDISEVPGGYKVILPGGSQVILPFTEVSVTAVSRSAAYETLRDTVKIPNVESHLSLSRWCLTNQLWTEAEFEAKAALQLEPSRQESQILFQQIDQFLHPEQITAAPVGPSAALPTSSFASPVERTSTGLTQATNKVYVGQIQPLLMNQCGNGACHGRISTQQFKLNNVRLESANLRAATEANLKVLAEWIDVAHPEQSPLLVKANDQSSHHARNFTGRQNAQYQLLLNWVRQYASEMDATEIAVKERKNASPVSPAHFESTGGMSELKVAEATPQESLTPTGPPRFNRSAASPGIPDSTMQFRKNQQHDPFDPNIFNTMMEAERQGRR